MADAALAMLAVALLGAVALAGLVAVAVVPFVVTLQRAERRGVSTTRAGALSLVGSAAALGLALLLGRGGAVPLPVALVVLVLAGVAPVVVDTAPAWLGRRGAHEPTDARPRAASSARGRARD